MESKDLCQTLSKAFDMSKATAKVSPKQLKEDDQESVRKARSPVELHFVLGDGVGVVVVGLDVIDVDPADGADGMLVLPGEQVHCLLVQGVGFFDRVHE